MSVLSINSACAFMLTSVLVVVGFFAQKQSVADVKGQRWVFDLFKGIGNNFVIFHNVVIDENREYCIDNVAKLTYLSLSKNTRDFCKFAGSYSEQ